MKYSSSGYLLIHCIVSFTWLCHQGLHEGYGKMFCGKNTASPLNGLGVEREM